MVPSWLLAANRRRSSALAGLCVAALALPTLANAAPEQSVEKERTWVGTQIGSTIAKDRFCDVNGDSRDYGYTTGKQDIVTASPSGLVTVIPGGNPGGKMPVAGTSSFKIPASPDVSVSCVLDVDHDGKDEILVSSSTAGKAWLIYGRTDFSDVDYTKLSEKGQGFTITGTPGTTHFSAVFAGKYDGDYRSDIVVLNPEGNYSVAYLLNADSRSDKDLNDYTTSNQKLYSPEGMFFDSVQPVGNVDGSGHTDYVFTTSDANGKHGKAWLVTNIGTSSFLNDPFAGIPEINLEENTYLGKATTAANAGDVNGDGYDDTLIGFNGGVALLYGASTLPNTYTINSANQTDPNVAVLTGTGSGWSVASYAREGKPNLVAVGAPHAGDGEVYYFPTTAFTAGSHPISGLGDQVTTIKAKQPGTRFGISVAFSGAWPTETPILVAGADNATKETPASAADFGPNAYIQAVYLGPAATPTPVPTQTAPAAPTQEPTAEPTREPTAAPTQEPTAIAIPQEPRTPLAPLPVVPAKPSPLPAPVDAGVLVTDKLPSANAKVKTGAVHSSKLAITGLDAASGLVALALLTTGAGALVLRSRRSA